MSILFSTSMSQSLFQVYYLGSVAVDKRCSSAVIPWAIEELKLELQDMKLVWVTLGPSSIDYVADSGEEVDTHSYDSILRWSKGLDEVSFAYIISVGEKSSCHAFQCLDLQESDVIVKLFKEHCSQFDVSDTPLKMAGDQLASLTQQNRKKMKSRGGRSIIGGSDASFPITYCGNMNIKLKSISASTVDTLVSCLAAKNRPTSAKKYKKWRSKRKRSHQYTAPQSNTIFRLGSNSDETVMENTAGTNDEDDDPLVTVSSVTVLTDSLPAETARPRASSDITRGNETTPPTLHNSMKPKLAKSDSDSGNKRKRSWIFDSLRKGPTRNASDDATEDTAISILEDTHFAGKEEEESVSEREGSADKEEESVGKKGRECAAEESIGRREESATPTPATRLDVLDSSTEQEGDDQEEIDGDNDDEYDVLPELQQLQLEPEFASLGVDEVIKSVRECLTNSTPAVLTLAGLQMKITSSSVDIQEVVTSVDDILTCAVRRVLGCAQGLVSSEYVGFITREKKSTSYFFHLLKAADAKTAAALIKAFKYSFDYCVSLSLPFTVCEHCPIHQLNSICQSLNDMSLTEGQLQIHDLTLNYLTEQEYSTLVKDYRKDPFENEHTQLVRWVALLCKVFHHQQLSHTHGSKKERKKTHTGKRAAAKLLSIKSVTGSYDNLKTAEHDRKAQLKSDVGGLQSLSASDITFSSSQQLNQSSPIHSPSNEAIDDVTVSWAHSREGSLSTTPELPHRKILPNSHTFPATDLPSPILKRQYNYFSRPRTDSGALPRAVSPLAADSGQVSPTGQQHTSVKKGRGHKRSMSWRQQIFESVTPSKKEEFAKRKASIKQVMEMELSLNLSQRMSFIEEDETPSERAKRRWDWAINQQLLLIRLEKENQSVIRESLRRHKLNYTDPAVDNVVMGRVWLKLLEDSEPSSEDLLAAIKMGVPPKLRERVWHLLVCHYRSCHPGEVPASSYTSSIDELQYSRLREQSTEYEAVITADIDRTYPSHPYFSYQVKHGRLALYNILRAYAVADSTVGYCQGLSFVAGLILLHSPSELEAFQLLCHFMNLYGFRNIYSFDMYDLQIKLYQFSRLLHDALPNLHSHLEEHDVTPFLYAAPWFLTVFCSQFPIPFVARIMDLVLFEGISAVFKVGLAILTHYQFDIMELHHMEPITDFLKTTIPQRVMDSVAEILHTSTQITGLSIKLQTFETEYHVMHELMATFHMKQSSSVDMESMNELLRKQNKDLIEQLAVCRGAIMRLEKSVELCHAKLDEQQWRIENLEQKRKCPPTVDVPVQTIDSIDYSDHPVSVYGQSHDTDLLSNSMETAATVASASPNID